MDQNCNSNLPSFTCTFGNVSGILSTILWFTVLVPQVVRNQQRRSVTGLNPLWAIANFTASLSNAFFMFRIDVPVQTRLSAIYMPLLEFVMLLQFYFWWDHHDNRKSSSSHFCRRNLIPALLVLIWGAIIVIQIFWYESSAKYFSWIAIGLWSIETFPQLYTNIASPTKAVLGQSVISILITVCGKTTDSLSAFLLDMPMQTRILAYFSGTSAWLNAFYVLVVYVKRNRTANIILKEEEEEVENENDKLIKTSKISANGNQNEENESLNCCYALEDKLEKSIRSILVDYSFIRYGVGLLLLGLISAVVIACFLTMKAAGSIWIVFLMLAVSVVIVGGFHIFLFCSRRTTTTSEKTKE